jgi:hypothetical protein
MQVEDARSYSVWLIFRGQVAAPDTSSSTLCDQVFARLTIRGAKIHKLLGSSKVTTPAPTTSRTLLIKLATPRAAPDDSLSL